ncbi:MAG: DUF1622 domain-containing protein [Planctomycetia bacterium]|nr:DUF1622 domain-containing protein [Planctomycetia bacterium]
MLESTMRLGTTALAILAEATGAAIIGIAVVRGLIAYLVDLAADRAGVSPKEAIRLNLGRSLALALEFLLGADILRTAVAPSWREIGQLAAIVVIRTFLNYFLQRELDSAARRAEAPPTDPVVPGRAAPPAV